MDIKKILKYTIGWGFIILGFISLFLPFSQGIFMIIIGIVILKGKQFLKKIKNRLKNVRY